MKTTLFTRLVAILLAPCLVMAAGPFPGTGGPVGSSGHGSRVTDNVFSAQALAAETMACRPGNDRLAAERIAPVIAATRAPEIQASPQIPATNEEAQAARAAELQRVDLNPSAEDLLSAVWPDEKVRKGKISDWRELNHFQTMEEAEKRLRKEVLLLLQQARREIGKREKASLSTAVGPVFRSLKHGPGKSPIILPELTEMEWGLEWLAKASERKQKRSSPRARTPSRAKPKTLSASPPGNAPVVEVAKPVVPTPGIQPAEKTPALPASPAPRRYKAGRPPAAKVAMPVVPVPDTARTNQILSDKLSACLDSASRDEVEFVRSLNNQELTEDDLHVLTRVLAFHRFDPGVLPTLITTLQRNWGPLSSETLQQIQANLQLAVDDGNLTRAQMGDLLHPMATRQGTDQGSPAAIKPPGFWNKAINGLGLGRLIRIISRRLSRTAGPKRGPSSAASLVNLAALLPVMALAAQCADPHFFDSPIALNWGALLILAGYAFLFHEIPHAIESLLRGGGGNWEPRRGWSIGISFKASRGITGILGSLAGAIFFWWVYDSGYLAASSFAAALTGNFVLMASIGDWADVWNWLLEKANDYTSFVENRAARRRHRQNLLTRLGFLLIAGAAAGVFSTTDRALAQENSAPNQSAEPQVQIGPYAFAENHIFHVHRRWSIGKSGSKPVWTLVEWSANDGQGVNFNSKVKMKTKSREGDSRTTGTEEETMDMTAGQLRRLLQDGSLADPNVKPEAARLFGAGFISGTDYATEFDAAHQRSEQWAMELSLWKGAAQEQARFFPPLLKAIEHGAVSGFRTSEQLREILMGSSVQPLDWTQYMVDQLADAHAENPERETGGKILVLGDWVPYDRLLHRPMLEKMVDEIILAMVEGFLGALETGGGNLGLARHVAWGRGIAAHAAWNIRNGMPLEYQFLSAGEEEPSEPLPITTTPAVRRWRFMPPEGTEEIPMFTALRKVWQNAPAESALYHLVTALGDMLWYFPALREPVRPHIGPLQQDPYRAIYTLWLDEAFRQRLTVSILGALRTFVAEVAAVFPVPGGETTIIRLAPGFLMNTVRAADSRTLVLTQVHRPPQSSHYAMTLEPLEDYRSGLEKMISHYPRISLLADDVRPIHSFVNALYGDPHAGERGRIRLGSLFLPFLSALVLSAGLFSKTAAPYLIPMILLAGIAGISVALFPWRWHARQRAPATSGGLDRRSFLALMALGPSMALAETGPAETVLANNAFSPERDLARSTLISFFQGPWSDFVNAPSEETRQVLGDQARIIDASLTLNGRLVEAIAAIQHLDPDSPPAPQMKKWVLFNEEILHRQFSLFAAIKSLGPNSLESYAYKLLPRERSVKLAGTRIVFLEGRRIDQTRSPALLALNFAGSVTIFDLQAISAALEKRQELLFLPGRIPLERLARLVKKTLGRLYPKELLRVYRRVLMREQLAQHLYALCRARCTSNDHFGVPDQRWNSFGAGTRLDIEQDITLVLHMLASAEANSDDQLFLALTSIMKVLAREEMDSRYWATRYVLFRLTYLNEPISEIRKRMGSKKFQFPRNFEKDFLDSRPNWQRNAALALARGWPDMEVLNLTFDPDFGALSSAAAINLHSSGTEDGQTAQAWGQTRLARAWKTLGVIFLGGLSLTFLSGHGMEQGLTAERRSA